jgi:DNA polymerase III psi subunit
MIRVIEERQRAYLEAMNIPLWELRDQPVEIHTPVVEVPLQVEKTPAAPTPAVSQVEVETTGGEAAAEHQKTKKSASHTPGLNLGPGAGGVMLVCAKDSDSSSKIANDISRALGKMPVWAWPDAAEQSVSPADAVNENLFTCVAVFGEALSHLLFGDEIPGSLGSAKLVQLPAMSELASSASARRELWSVLCRSGMIVH